MLVGWLKGLNTDLLQIYMPSRTLRFPADTRKLKDLQFTCVQKCSRMCTCLPALCCWRWIVWCMHVSCIDSDVHSCPLLILMSTLFKKKYSGQRSFSYQGPVTWNNLPLSIRHTQTYSSFKSQLKTHSFSQTFQ